MQFWHARLDTGRDQFDAYGRSKDAALAALEKAVSSHARQSELPASWALQYARGGKYEDSVVVRHALMGAAYRYGDGGQPIAYAPEASR